MMGVPSRPGCLLSRFWTELKCFWHQSKKDGRERSVFFRISSGMRVPMSVAALSTAGFSQYVASSSNVSASQQAWQSLEQSLNSGNLTAAQSAFNTYNQLNQSASSTSGSSSSSTSQLSTDMKALGSAISSGDLSTAQSAFATVANDLKSTPSQAVSNAEAAVNQTVQWMDDLLSLSSASSAPTTPVDPTTSILDAAYGQNAGTNGTGTSSTSSASTDPTTSILNSVYGDGTAGSSGTSAASGNTAAAASSADAPSQAVPSPLANGNAGSGASVNVYA